MKYIVQLRVASVSGRQLPVQTPSSKLEQGTTKRKRAHRTRTPSFEETDTIQHITKMRKKGQTKDNQMAQVEVEQTGRLVDAVESMGTKMAAAVEKLAASHNTLAGVTDGNGEWEKKFQELEAHIQQQNKRQEESIQVGDERAKRQEEKIDQHSLLLSRILSAVENR